MRRKAIHRTEVLDALVDDLVARAPDHVVITGDLTNLSLDDEFIAARQWLERIGDPENVTAIPGNHDAYVSMRRDRSWDRWSEYLASDAEARALYAEDTEGGSVEFPTLRVRGSLAIVGVCSAIPTPPFFASGAVGSAQLGRLERILTDLSETDAFRVVLIHHPPDPGATSSRRALQDADALCALLRRTGADLVLHGHLHRTRIASIEGPNGAIPVVCVRSASDFGSKPGKRAQYHLFDIDEDGVSAGRPRFRIKLRARGWSPTADCFLDDSEGDGFLLGSD